MNKKISIIISVVGILLIIIGVSSGIYSYINNENKKIEQKEKLIIENHNDFKDKVEEFNALRKEYYSKVEIDLFNEAVATDYSTWISVIETYEKSVEEVEKNSVQLKELCINQFYKNQDIINKCDAFIINYETVINYYVKEITAFNKFINDYQKENKDEEIKEYDLKEYVFVDVNSDGKFIGKD